MEDSKLEALKLIDRYLNGSCTEQERILVESMYNKSTLAKGVEEKDIDFNKTGRQSWAYIAAATSAQKTKRFTLWPRIASVAAVVALIAFGIWMRSSRSDTSSVLGSSSADIGPGKYGATLTLADGKTIRLSDAANGQLAEQAGIKITKTEKGQLIYEVKGPGAAGSQSTSGTTNTLATARGETYQVRLPDGTNAWLNAASSITFPLSFAGSEQRKVETTGEVYLEVYKDASHPFIVLSEAQQIEVLGTHFNVNSYDDREGIKTTLLEGAVRVSPLASRNDVMLKPGQQSIFKAEDIQVKSVDVKEVIAWKEGDFRFVDQSVTDILKHIARWYNVEVVYEDDVSDIRLNASISRNRNVSQILKMMEKTDEVHFKIEGRRIIVRR